jgi:methylglutaconyl-CoA hydratase
MKKMNLAFNYIKFEVEDKIGYLTLNRPEKRNALSDKVVEELTAAFEQIESSDEVKIVILKAEGKAFCAGADLEYLKRISQNSYEENLKDSIHLKDLFYKIYSLNKIVIAQIQGHAIAGGAGLASVCDYSYAVTEANFGFTEVKLGFIPAIVSVFLVNKVGEGKTRDLLLSGKIISAQTAREIGIINRVVEDNLETAVIDFAKELLNTTSGKSIAMTKKLLVELQKQALNDNLLKACEMNAKMRETTDFKKGVTAFLNKETPKWS